MTEWNAIGPQKDHLAAEETEQSFWVTAPQQILIFGGALIA